MIKCPKHSDVEMIMEVTGEETRYWCPICREPKTVVELLFSKEIEELQAKCEHEYTEEEYEVEFREGFWSKTFEVCQNCGKKIREVKEDEDEEDETPEEELVEEEPNPERFRKKKKKQSFWLKWRGEKV